MVVNRGHYTRFTGYGITRTIEVHDPTNEFDAFLLPYLSMPKQGPKCKLGSHRVFHLILWILSTGIQWKCFPLPTDAQGKPALHDTNVYRAFATWAHDGSLQQAFLASVAHLAAEKHLDLRVLHGDGTNTVAKKGAMGLGMQGTNTRRATKSSPSRTPTGMCWLPSPWLPSMRRTRSCSRRA
jgi:transposase